jgi:hypothetical protein
VRADGVETARSCRAARTPPAAAAAAEPTDGCASGGADRVRAIIAKCCQRRSFEIPSAVSPFTRKLPPSANADPAISAPPQLGEYTYASTMSDGTHLPFLDQSPESWKLAYSVFAR